MTYAFYPGCSLEVNAAAYNVSVKAVIKWSLAKRIPTIHMGRLIRFPRQEVERRLLGAQLLAEGKQPEVV